MSSLNIEERFTLDAPPATVWRFLTDPERVVSCLPGAELTGQEDESTYEGSMKVSAGPVTVAYKGTAIFEEIDDHRRYVRVVGRGRERSGSGNASMTMESRVEETDEGGTAVSVTADVKVTGKIVRFGRGMIESVSAEMFSDFTKRLRERVEQEEESTSDPGREGGTGREEDSPSDPGRVEDSPGDPGRAAAGSPRADGDPEEKESLQALPLLWRAFKRWLKRLFG